MSEKTKFKITRITYSSDVHSSDGDQSNSSSGCSKPVIDDRIGQGNGDSKTNQTSNDQGSTSRHISEANTCCSRSTGSHFNTGSVLMCPYILSKENLLALLDDRGVAVNICMDKMTLIRLYQQYIIPRAKRPDRPLSQRLRDRNQQDDTFIASINQPQNSNQSQPCIAHGNIDNHQSLMNVQGKRTLKVSQQHGIRLVFSS